MFDPGRETEAAQLEAAAQVLKAVAHPLRLRVIELLEGGEKTVTELQDALGVAQSTMSQQLIAMKSRGVLSSRRNGNQVYYAIANRDVLLVVHCVRGRLDASRRWSHA
jgi:ArsR family transcriptional regulator